MPHNWIILLLVVPMLAAIASLFFTGRRSFLSRIGLLALTANLLLSGWGLATVYPDPDGQIAILVSQMGDWPAPFGITLVLDPLAALMLFITALVLLAVYVYCLEQLPAMLQSGFFHPLYHLLAMGVQWSFLTGDLFNLFVAFEIMLMASYVLLVQGGSANQMRQAYKYILLNLFASMMFVTSCGLIYGQTGTLNMADLARLCHAGQLPPGSIPVFALLLIVFGVKTAIFPLWFWLPDTYHTLHPALGGLFAGLLTKVGAYVLIRTFAMILGSPAGGVSAILAPVILVSSGITMFLGVLGAVSMNSVRRILSIHIISQVGYMILGIGIGIAIGVATENRILAIAGAIFFVIHNMVVKCCLFLCAGLMHRHAGSDDLTRIGGLLKRSPWLAALFFIAALSLAGLPPLSGFFGKWILLRESFTTGHFTLAAIALATSLLTLLSMLKIWSYGFWSPLKQVAFSDGRAPEPRPRTRWAMASVAALVVVALTMGLGAAAWFDLSRAAARAVVEPRAYIQAVLGDAHPPAPLPVATLNEKTEAP